MKLLSVLLSWTTEQGSRRTTILRPRTDQQSGRATQRCLHSFWVYDLMSYWNNMAGAWNVIEKAYWSSQLGPSLDIAIELNRWKPPPIVSPTQLNNGGVEVYPFVDSLRS